MKRIIFFCMAVLMTTATFAQDALLRQRLELVENENEVTGLNLEVFQMQDNGKYYLSVGNLGIGTDIVQLKFDPVYELFIPLGETLAEAVETMKTIQGWYKMARKESKSIDGCLSAAYPNDKVEQVAVTRRQLLTERLLEFSVKRDGLVRATYINKADFSSLVTGLKLYKKLHPKEK